jgi:hypothetical protein
MSRDTGSTREPFVIGQAVCLWVLLALVSTGCVSAPALDTARRAAVPDPSIRFGVDTIAFANENRFKHRGKPDLYANWCFVMARAITQFHRFARFDPDAPHLAPAQYTERVRQITARPPWHPAPLPDERIVIPGYASLYEFSRAQEPAVKAGFTGRLVSWFHWTNWRVVYPMPRAQQEGVARETLAELQAGRPVQWLVTNLPTIDLNHTVVVYGYRADAPDVIDFSVYDPNDPASPGTIRFDVPGRRFWATRLYDAKVGPIRAFRMYYSPLL